MADSISGAAACVRCRPEAACSRLLPPPATSSSRRAIGGLYEAPLAGQGQSTTLRAQVQRAELRARTVALSLVRVGVRIIALHVASVRKLLKLPPYVRGRLPHWAAGGGNDGAASCPARGVLFLCKAAEARSGRKARCRAGG